jgi:hypothetical protein
MRAPARGSETLPKDSVAASTTRAEIGARGDLVVIDKRAIDDRFGWLIYSDGVNLDSTMLELGVLGRLVPGDLLSDGGASIDR